MHFCATVCFFSKQQPVPDKSDAGETAKYNGQFPKFFDRDCVKHVSFFCRG